MSFDGRVCSARARPAVIVIALIRRRAGRRGTFLICAECRRSVVPQVACQEHNRKNIVLSVQLF